MATNRIQYQNSDRCARPENLVMLPKPEVIASAKPIMTPNQIGPNLTWLGGQVILLR
jgi:hypothetical protein